MPRPMLKTPQTQAKTNSILSATEDVAQQQKQQMNKLQVEQILRKPRSKEYMEAIHQLDAGGHVHNQNKVNAIINIIKSEFPDLELSGILLGYISICYLGNPYEVHTLDMTGMIINHFKAGQSLPSGMERARALAIRGGYDFIEVYTDCCRAISSNGAVSVIRC